MDRLRVPLGSDGVAVLSLRRFGQFPGGREAHVDVRVNRAYEPAAPTDGCRVLIDRLWPRGLSQRHAKLDRFDEFRRRYIEELRNERPRLTALRRQAREGTLTLVHSAHDSMHNDAIVLAEVLRRGLPRGPR
jgi:uncharacterized protein YeaO (DUF488 family)